MTLRYVPSDPLISKLYEVTPAILQQEQEELWARWRRLAEHGNHNQKDHGRRGGGRAFLEESAREWQYGPAARAIRHASVDVIKGDEFYAGGGLSDEAPEKAALALWGGIQDSETHDVLHRGTRLTRERADAMLERLEVGEEYALPLTSFSKNPEVAGRYKRSPTGRGGELEVDVSIEARNTKGLDINGLLGPKSRLPQDEEVITGGVFKVAALERGEREIKVVLEGA